MIDINSTTQENIHSNKKIVLILNAKHLWNYWIKKATSINISTWILHLGKTGNNFNSKTANNIYKIKA